jgi:hypothetical protein
MLAAILISVVGTVRLVGDSRVLLTPAPPSPSLLKRVFCNQSRRTKPRFENCHPRGSKLPKKDVGVANMISTVQVLREAGSENQNKDTPASHE